MTKRLNNYISSIKRYTASRDTMLQLAAHYKITTYTKG